jgi:hypothetical protein
LPPCRSRSCCTAMAKLTRMFQNLVCFEVALRLHKRIDYHLLFTQILFLKHGFVSFSFCSARTKVAVGNNELS